MSPSKCAPPPKKKVELRYVGVVSSALALGIIALGVMLGVTAGKNAALAHRLENQYQRSYYDLVANIDALVVGDEGAGFSNEARGSYDVAENVRFNANMAIANLAALPVRSENTTDTISLLNAVAKQGTASHMDELKDLQARLNNFNTDNSERIVDNLNDKNRKKRVTELEKLFIIKA